MFSAGARTPESAPLLADCAHFVMLPTQLPAPRPAPAHGLWLRNLLQALLWLFAPGNLSKLCNLARRAFSVAAALQTYEQMLITLLDRVVDPPAVVCLGIGVSRFRSEGLEQGLLPSSVLHPLRRPPPSAQRKHT